MDDHAANKIIAEFECIFGKITATERKWLVEKIVDLRDQSGANANKYEAAIRYACELLSEFKYGNPARSPAHNARLHLESALNNLKVSVFEQMHAPPEYRWAACWGTYDAGSVCGLGPTSEAAKADLINNYDRP